MNQKCIGCGVVYYEKQDNGQEKLCPDCRKRKRKENIYACRTKRWFGRTQKHLCGDCGKKVKPELVYHCRCKECRDKITKYKKAKHDNKII